MDNELNKLGEAARKFSLDAREKASLRARLEIAVSRPVASPVWHRALSAAWRDFFSAPFGRAVALRPVLATVAIAVLLSGAGVSLAAEGAVPGDALYAVKVRFNEEVRGALTVGKLDKIVWEGERAARRIEEGEILVRQGRLDEAAKLDIVNGYLEHMEKAVERVEAVGVKDKVGAARVEERLRAQWERSRGLIGKMKSNEELRGGEIEGGRKGGAWREPKAEDRPFGADIRDKKEGRPASRGGGD